MTKEYNFYYYKILFNLRVAAVKKLNKEKELVEKEVQLFINQLGFALSKIEDDIDGRITYKDKKLRIDF